MAKDPTPQQWAATVLQGLGIPQSPGALQALVGWERAEGGHWNNSARYNPLNTTQREPGSKTFRSVGQGAADIGIYNSWDQGVQATVKTLQNGRYGNILNALKAGDPNAVAGAIGSSPWGTNGGLVAGAIRGTKVSGNVSPFAAAGSAANEAPAAAPASLTGGVSNPGQSADASALISLLGQRPQQHAAAGPANLPTPAAVAGPALPQAYRALSGGQAPAPKQNISPLLAAVQTPGQAAANVAAQASPLVADASSGATSRPSGGTGGAQAALGWAESKLGFRETGTNSGGLASYLNSRFGMSNQPWCAMFTSAAVTKGGAPATARTASVAEVRRQAEQGGGGYQKGFISTAHAQPGDLILFGNSHIGMVKAVSRGKVTYVGGNQSDGVTEATTTSGDIVRPRYGAGR